MTLFTENNHFSIFIFVKSISSVLAKSFLPFRLPTCSHYEYNYSCKQMILGYSYQYLWILLTGVLVPLTKNYKIVASGLFGLGLKAPFQPCVTLCLCKPMYSNLFTFCICVIFFKGSQIPNVLHALIPNLFCWFQPLKFFRKYWM